MTAKLIMTVEQMQDRQAWLKLRNNGLGGSDAATVLGVSPWKSALALWAEKTGQKEPEDLSKNQRVYWGQKNEQNIAEWFMEQTGKRVIRRGMMQSCEHPWMLASVDREVVGESAGLEIKTAGVDQARQWLEDEMPTAYYLQIQWYLAVTGWDKWYVAVLIGGNEARWKEVVRNEEQIAELIKAGEEFWKHVTDRTPPPPDGSESAGKTLSILYPGGQASEPVELNAPEIWEALEQFHQHEQAEKAAARAKEQAKQVLMDAMGNNEIALIKGEKVTWKTQAGRTTVDSKRLKAEEPAVYQKYIKVGSPMRVFKVAGGK